MNKKPKVTIDGKKLKSQKDVEQYLRQRIGSLENQVRRLQSNIGFTKEFAREIGSAVVASRPFPAYRYSSPKKNGALVVPLLKFSDWHIGEVIKRDETEGFGVFNWEIAQARVFGIVDAFLKYVEVQRNAYNIRECVVSCEGDFGSGDIHDELRVTNEFPLPVQAANAGLLLGEAVRRIAPHFQSVRLIEIGGDNHGRLWKKKQAKQKTTNSMNYVVYEVANAHLEKLKGVQVERAPGIKHLALVNGWRFLIAHGDTVYGWMGIPYYGIERDMGREAHKRMDRPAKRFNYISVGHWHVPAVLQNKVLINGSLSGTSEFDHSKGRHAGPAQVAALVHKEHGLFNWTPFRME